MTDAEIIACVVEAREGTAVADQFRAVVLGHEFWDDQNDYALKLIAKVCKDIAYLRAPDDKLAAEALECADAISHFLEDAA